MSFRNRIAPIALFAVALVPLGLAQMGPGMGSGTGNGSGTGTGIGMGPGRGMEGGGLAGMSNIMTGLTVGPDGTAYLVRNTGTTATGMMYGATGGAALIAINPQTGSAKWKAPIDGTMMSQPVVSAGGSIFLTTSEPPVLGTTATRQPAFLVLSAATGAVVNRVSIAADMLSLPIVSPDGQTIYVMAVDLSGIATAGMSGSSTLYGFSPSGAVKFKVVLSQL